MSYIGLDQWEKGDKERTGMEKYISSPNPEVPTQKSQPRSRTGPSKTYFISTILYTRVLLYLVVSANQSLYRKRLNLNLTSFVRISYIPRNPHDKCSLAPSSDQYTSDKS